MRKLEVEELESFFNRIRSGEEAPDNYDSGASAFREFFERNPEDIGEVHHIARHAFELSGKSIDTALVSLFGTAFQMGREFEISFQEAMRLQELMEKKHAGRL